MPSIGKNQTANGHFLGAGGGRGAAFDNVAITADGKQITETQARQMSWDSEQAKGKEAMYGAPDTVDAEIDRALEERTHETDTVPVPQAFGPEHIPFSSDIFFNVPKVNMIVSDTLPRGKVWHFPASESYMVAREDWEEACDRMSKELDDMKRASRFTNNDTPPESDPQMGPLMAMMGGL